MNFNGLFSVLVALIGVLPALISILPNIFTSFRKKAVGLAKPSSIKVLQVKRLPFSKKVWQKIRRRYLIYTLLGLTADLIILIALFIILEAKIYTYYFYLLVFSRYNIYQVDFFFNVLLILLPIYFIYFGYNFFVFKSFGKIPEFNSLNWFGIVIVKVSGSFSEIFEHINSALIFMDSSSIDFDSNKQEIRASFGTFLRRVIIIVNIQTEEDAHYLIEVNYSTNALFKAIKVVNNLINLTFFEPKEANHSVNTDVHNHIPKHSWFGQLFRRV